MASILIRSDGLPQRTTFDANSQHEDFDAIAVALLLFLDSILFCLSGRSVAQVLSA